MFSNFSGVARMASTSKRVVRYSSTRTEEKHLTLVFTTSNSPWMFFFSRGYDCGKFNVTMGSKSCSS